MANLIASIESVSAPDPTRRRLQLLIRGQRRNFIRNLLRTALVAQGSDTRERVRAEAQNYNPVLFAHRQTVDNQLKAIISRCQELLAARG